MKALGWMAAGLAMTAVACSGSTSNDVSVAVVAEPIIGGAAASTTYPEAALVNGKLAAGGGYLCSATLIAPKVLLTAGHCVTGVTSWDVYVGTTYRTAKTGEVFDWVASDDAGDNPAHHDIGLVYLDEAVSLAAFPTLSSTKRADGTAAVSVGRVSNGAVTTSVWEASITLSDGAAAGYPYDYTSVDVIQDGDSGGPVFVAGTHQLVAVNSGSNQLTQVTARVDLVYAWIEARVASHAATASELTAAGNDSSKPVAPSTNMPTGPCTSEAESNDTLATASPLAQAECGALSGGDVDWFTMNMPEGISQVTLYAAGDAVMQAGYVSDGNCVITSENIRVATLTITGGPAEICFSVASPSQATQSYRLSEMRFGDGLFRDRRPPHGSH